MQERKWVVLISIFFICCMGLVLSVYIQSKSQKREEMQRIIAEVEQELVKMDRNYIKY